MVILYGIGFVLAAILLVSGGIYLVFADRKPKKIKPKSRRKVIKGPKWTKSEKGGVVIPAEIPRNVSTIQTMADEDPEIVAEVVKMWLDKK